MHPQKQTHAHLHVNSHTCSLPCTLLTHLPEFPIFRPRLFLLFCKTALLSFHGSYFPWLPLLWHLPGLPAAHGRSHGQRLGLRMRSLVLLLLVLWSWGELLIQLLGPRVLTHSFTCPSAPSSHLRLLLRSQVLEYLNILCPPGQHRALGLPPSCAVSLSQK